MLQNRRALAVAPLKRNPVKNNPAQPQRTASGTRPAVSGGAQPSTTPAPATTRPPPRTLSGTYSAQHSSTLPPGAKSSIPAPDRVRVEVELNVFSGDPNPRWLLGKIATDRLLARLPKEDRPVPAIPSGYRGFIIRIESAAGTRTVQVFHNPELERWLLSSGRFCLSEGLAKYVERQLS
ncbi:MAG TPA: hypothetical protein VL137_17480 [Polyangiaceae bacterium]|nr:hypothetical protein [Polyangiaceae bacterium]